jgi:hypothetical protein
MKLSELRARLRVAKPEKVEPDASPFEDQSGSASDAHIRADWARKHFMRERSWWEKWLHLPPSHAACRSVTDSLRMSEIDPNRSYKCPKCGMYYTPDPKLGFVPSTCAACDSYL